MNKVKVWLVKRKNKAGAAYAVQWLDPRTGQRRTESVGSDKAYARQKVAERRQELLSGLYCDIKYVSFDDFKKEHLQQSKGNLAEGSYESHDLVLRQFKEICNPKGLMVIDFAMLERFRKARLDAGVSVATVNKDLRTLQSIFERAVKRSYLKQNPFVGNRKALYIKEPERNPVSLTPDEYRQLLSACLNDRHRAICILGYHAGLRQGEILALEWSDVDFANGLLYVRNKADHLTKSRRERAIPMSAEVVSTLKTLEPGRFKSNLIFNLEGRRVRNNVNRGFKALVKRAGLVDEQKKPRFSMHDLRRSFVTTMLSAGVDPKTVQTLAGHADLGTTMKHYCTVSAKAMAAAVDRMSRLVKAAT